MKSISLPVLVKLQSTLETMKTDYWAILCPDTQPLFDYISIYTIFFLMYV